MGYSVKRTLFSQRMIVARVSKAGKRFDPSRITGINLAEVRPIEGHVARLEEQDFFFNYQGKSYRVNQYIVPDENGDVRGSRDYRYELVEL